MYFYKPASSLLINPSVALPFSCPEFLLFTPSLFLSDFPEWLHPELEYIRVLDFKGATLVLVDGQISIKPPGRRAVFQILFRCIEF
jgi:hypothetical protein